MKEVKFNVMGMTCSSCVSHVERAVKSLEGINNVNVNLLSNNMIVKFNDEVINEEKIILAVKNVGYDASIYNKSFTNIKNKETQDNLTSMKRRLIISICFLIPLMCVSMVSMLQEQLNISMSQIFKENLNPIILPVIQFLLIIPIIYFNRNYFIVGIKRLFKKTPNMDSLIALGSGAAVIYGIFAIFMISYGLCYKDIMLVERYATNIYFESAGTILTLITLGKYLEAKSKNKTSDAITKLINLSPKTAIVLKDNKETEINTEEILMGDIVVIKPGSNIPVDGIIIYGTSYADQSSITGESIPVEKTIGDQVISGTINKNGYIKIEATKVGENTTLSQIIKLVEEASNSKAPISRLADKVSYIFVPCVILIAMLTFVFWMINFQNVEFALTMGISVLVISCPCALGLATPVAIMVGTGKAASKQILIKSAESLEKLHSIDTILIDKTGTITEGIPSVTDVVSLIDENEFFKIAGALEKKSQHPLALAIIKKIEEKNIEEYDLTEFEYIIGKGVKGKICDKTYFAGNLKLLKDNNIDCSDIKKNVEKYKRESKTVIYFASEETIIGLIALTDAIKDTSKSAIEKLKNNGIDVIMITGDNIAVAKNVSERVGINTVIADVLPQEKEEKVRRLQESGRKVAFVGDGINDTPALVTSDVGIAIGAGSDIAIDSADIILIRNDLMDVFNSIKLSRTVMKNIKMNLFWAFFYNVIGIPIAAGVFYLSFGLKLNPMIGALAMSLSSVCVVTNALRINKFKFDTKEQYKMNKKIKVVNIEGMQCQHCKKSVEKVLLILNNVLNVEVDLDNKTATIEYDNLLDDIEIKNVVEEEGFVVKSIITK